MAEQTGLTLSSLFTGLSSGLTSASGTFMSGFSAKGAGQYTEGAYRYNAAISEMMADESIRMGKEAAGKLKIRARGLIGKQRSSFAGQNVVVSSGSAAEVQEDTVRQSTLDSLEIQNNAWKVAWGYRSQAIEQRGAAEFTRIATKSAFQQSLITGGAQAANAALNFASGSMEFAAGLYTGRK